MGKKSKRMMPQEEISITREVNYIIEKAQQHDGRIVRLYSLILFSTKTGDAWILDSEDNTALCLARDGVRQEFFIEDTAKSFQIGWHSKYSINSGMFTVVAQNGDTQSILGYPVFEIQGH